MLVAEKMQLLLVISLTAHWLVNDKIYKKKLSNVHNVK